MECEDERRGPNCFCRDQAVGSLKKLHNPAIWGLSCTSAIAFFSSRSSCLYFTTFLYFCFSSSFLSYLPPLSPSPLPSPAPPGILPSTLAELCRRIQPLRCPSRILKTTQLQASPCRYLQSRSFSCWVPKDKPHFKVLVTAQALSSMSEREREGKRGRREEEKRGEKQLFQQSELFQEARSL